MFGATALWGASATLARFVFRDRHVPPLVAVELRLLIASTLLAAWLAWRNPAALRLRREDAGYFVVLGLFGVAAVQGSYYYTIARLGVGLAILIQYLAPSLIVLWVLVRGGRVGAATGLAVASGLLGVALLVGGVDRAALRARPLDWVVAASSAFSFAFYIVYSKRGLDRYSPATVLLYTFMIATLAWACVTPPWRIVAAGYEPALWGLFLVLGVCSTLLPFALFIAGLKRLPATQAGVLATLEPVIAVLSAAVLLGEGLRPLQWLGALLVLSAAMISSRGSSEALEAQIERA